MFDGMRLALGIKGLDEGVREARLKLALAEAQALRTRNEDAIKGAIERSLSLSYGHHKVPAFLEVMAGDDNKIHFKLRETDDDDVLRGSFPILEANARPAIRAAMTRPPRTAPEPAVLPPKTAPKPQSKQPPRKR